MRLRQVALASYDLDGVVAALSKVFGLKVAYNDPHIGHYGLKNAVLPAGTGFIEIVEPIAEGASAGRFLARRGGDAGYMLIIQTGDAKAETARAVGLGVRVVDSIDRPDYIFSHFHPSDFGGVLTSFDQQLTETDPLAPYGDWMPAGPDWREARTEGVIDLVGVTLENPEPFALARRWSDLLGRPLNDNDPLCLAMDHGQIRFAPSAGTGTSISTLDLRLTDPAAALARARAAGLEVSNQGVRVGGLLITVQA